MSEDAAARVMDGRAWSEFCDELKRLGAQVQGSDLAPDALNRAEGYRYLTRLLRGALESFLEHSDADFPALLCACHETIKLGADNPDNYYQSARLNPQHEYRISGSRGTVHYLGFSTVSGGYGNNGRMETTGFVDSGQLQTAPDGSIELVLSQQPRAGNWLAMSAETRSLNVRQTFLDRSTEQRAELRIERIGASGTPAPFGPEQLERGLRGVSRFLHGTTGLFENWAKGFFAHPNQLPAADQAYCQRIGGDPNIFYYHSAWRLRPDQALLIEAPRIPDCQSWNFQLDNVWMESLDYRYHRITVNKHSARYEADGSVKLLLAARDIGIGNWIDTAGHHDGTMCWRWIGAQEYPPLHTQVLEIGA